MLQKLLIMELLNLNKLFSSFQDKENEKKVHKNWTVGSEITEILIPPEIPN